MRGAARKTLDRLEAEDRLGVVLLARPYHNDPGLNHEILGEFQKLGYSVFTMDSLPVDEDILRRLFDEEVRAGVIKHPQDISDAWKNSYSENTSRRIWAAKYTARHPNLVALELSSFKCGHDAPIYTVVEEIVQNSGTPYFCFKNICSHPEYRRDLRHGLRIGKPVRRRRIFLFEVGGPDNAPRRVLSVQ